MLSKDREVDRFWGCEIEFDPSLDYWFSVRSIKIGATPLHEMKNELKKHIEPSVLRFRELIAKTMDANEAKKNESKQGPIHGHDDKEEEFSSITTPTTQKPDNDERRAKTEAVAEETFPDDKDKKEYIKTVSDPETKYKIVEVHTMRHDSPFFEIIPDLLSKTTHYNMNHAFFRDLYETLRKLEEVVKSENSDVEQGLDLIKNIRGSIDNLFFAYGEAYYDLDDLSKEQSVGDTIEELIVKWNLHLRKIYKQYDK